MSISARTRQSTCSTDAPEASGARNLGICLIGGLPHGERSQSGREDGHARLPGAEPETGLSLFGVLKQADPSLVDPGLTAQLECLLDEVVIGKQKVIGAIDAVCDVAQRIIGKLQEGVAIGGPPLLGAAIAGDAGSRPPTRAMKRFADRIAREKGVKPPPGYATTGSICRAFLNQHAPRKADAGIPVAAGPKPASPKQILFAEKLVVSQFNCGDGLRWLDARSLRSDVPWYA
jgi:hypothetical protein